MLGWQDQKGLTTLPGKLTRVNWVDKIEVIARATCAHDPATRRDDAMILTPITQHGGSILLHDHHGEYTGELANLARYEDGKHLRCLVIWDGYNLSSVRTALGLSDDDSIIDAAFHTIYGDKLDAFLADNYSSPYQATIWEISGEGIRRAFDYLLNALDTVPSGDDDTFDYWPNTMDMLWEFARDLDAMHSTTEHRTLVHDMAKRIHQTLLDTDWGRESIAQGIDDPVEMKGNDWLEWDGS